MQRVSLDRLRSSMVTSENVYTADGKLLLKKNTEIKDSYLKRLKQIGVPAVYVRNPYYEDATPPDIIDEITRVRLISSLQREFLAIREGKPWNVRRFIEMAEQIVIEVTLNSRALVQLTDIRSYNEFTFGHSVNVAVLSAVIGLAMGYPPRKLHDVALGGLLHDVGKMKVDPSILNKRGKLTDEEYSDIQQHAMLGFDVLRQAVPRIVPVPVMHMSLQHHERPDGNGYPRQMAKKEIHEYARIASVADVYDALTCDRPYCKARFPHEACLLMTEGMERQFDMEILTAFLTRVAIYPVGSVVLLSTGEIGVVTEVCWGMQNRPTVRLMIDRRQQFVNRDVRVDLREHPAVEVQRVLEEEAVFALSIDSPVFKESVDTKFAPES
ncbi:MAG: HD domain-containing phosphohydrolase [Negativicutes bacterium]